MTNNRLQVLDSGRVAVIAPGAGANGRDIVLDYIEECGLVQIQCPMTEDGEAPAVCPELCPIERCEASDRRDRQNRNRHR